MEDLEGFLNPDILFVPASGAPFLGVAEAAKLIRQLKPKIVIPSLFKVSGLKRKAGDLKDFFKEMDQGPKAQDKLVIKKKDLPSKLEVIWLSL